MTTNQKFVSLILVFSFAVLQAPLIAQSTQIRQEDRPEKPVTYCDDYISKEKDLLTKQADSKCKTMKETIACRDRKSGLDVYVTIVVQPSSKKTCPDQVSIAEEKSAMPMSRGAEADFTVEVLQEPCSRGGTTLTAYVPGDDGFDKKKRYGYNWFDGGRLISTERTIECAHSRIIDLKVMKVETGQFIKRTIAISPSSETGRNDYKMYGYEKTACYGDCPTYSVEIMKSGKAIWTGKANTERMGVWTAQLDERALQSIKNAVSENTYFDLRDKYPVEGTIADASQTITFVRQGDMQKSVSNVTGAPDNLTKFEAQLNKVIESLDWKTEGRMQNPKVKRNQKAGSKN